MSWLTIAWSMVAGACLVLGLMHLALWLMERSRREFLLFSICAGAASGVAIAEQVGLTAESLETYRTMDRWIPVLLAVMLTSLVWFVYIHLEAGRRWLALTITLLWVMGLVFNFLSPQSMTFREITALKQLPTWFGGVFTVAEALPNPAQHLGNAASVLILVFLTDVTMKLWQRGDLRRAGVIGGSSLLFIILAGVHTPLVDSGLVRTPYMVSFAFLAIVVAVSYELLRAVYDSSRLSQQIVASEGRWQALLKNVNLAVVSLDAQLRVTLVNPFFERTLGYRTAELTGHLITDLLPSTDVKEFRERFRVAAEHGPRPLARWAFRQASGSLRTFEWSTVRLLDAEGGFAGLLAVGADITEQLRAQTDLARVRHDLDYLSRTNLLGELLAALAHELNQPLTAILSNAQAGRRFLSQPEPDHQEIRTILDEIARDDKRAGEVIHRLRALLRKEPPVPAVFNLADAVRGVEQLVRGGLVAGDIQLDVELKAPTVRVKAVLVELQQVMMNLILNAAQALKDHPVAKREILVTVESDGEEARISVLDNGPGIDPGRLPSLFEPFVTSRAEGMGMGLSICRRLVHNNGGRIEAANRPESGAAFTFTLPID